MTIKTRKPADTVAEVLESYANRGVFRGFSKGKVTNGKANFRMLWHRDQFFDAVLDTKRGTIRIPAVLPNVPAKSTMYKSFKDFVNSKHDESLPDHRRIDPAKTEIKYRNSNGAIALTATTVDGDYEYAARKLIHLVHEIYLEFLQDGPYYDYMVENLGLDPDAY